MPEEKRRFHIVETDNLGGDYPNESFAAKDVPSERMARIMAEALDKAWGADRGGRRCFMVVADGYELEPGFEP